MRKFSIAACLVACFASGVGVGILGSTFFFAGHLADMSARLHNVQSGMDILWDHCVDPRGGRKS